ncbi:MAG TPA: zinc ribbon domain-containing protein [Blastocatellia bacterium]|jgi:uncharacterized paraquat-inducible protein A|nr:zinc ribbon domain-containing protein [Blastocatellia bacterium]
MFCPTCGFEYTQKTNYCKRCGASLTAADKAPATQSPNLKISAMFLVIAAFVLFSLNQIYGIYMKMLYANVRGPELFIPLLLSFALIGAVALLLVWQLSRVITVARRQAEQPTFIEVQPQAPLAAPADPIRQAVEPPSVIEHTTRQMAGAYLSDAQKK